MADDLSNNPLFRENAIKSLYANNESFDLFRVISVPSWLWLIFASSFVLSLLTWSIFGSVNIMVDGQGIILPEDSKALSIYSPSQGKVTSVLVKQGTMVKKGDILAKIFNPYLEEDFNFISARNHENEIKLEKFRSRYQERLTEIFQKYQQSEILYRNKIRHAKEKYATLHSLYVKKSSLYNKHYLTIMDIEKAKDEYLAAKEELETLNQNLFDNKLKFKNECTKLQEEMNQHSLTYDETKHALAKKMLEKHNFSTILSSEEGIVKNINIATGDQVNSGESLFTIITGKEHTPLETLVFINHYDGKKIQAGMPVYILPNELSAYDYGYILGKVVSTTEYPASKESVNTYLGNINLVDDFFASGAPYMIKVVMPMNAKTQSGLNWTSKRGAPFKIRPGTMATVKIITHHSSPINFMMKNLTPGE